MCISIALSVDLPCTYFVRFSLALCSSGRVGVPPTQGGLRRENAPTFSVRTVIVIYGN